MTEHSGHSVGFTPEVVVDKQITDPRLIELYRNAHKAALYAHMRMLLAKTFDATNPLLGLHGVCVYESLGVSCISAGSTPDPHILLGGIGGLQGYVLSSFVSRKLGDVKNAGVGDQVNLTLMKTQCVGCDDGDLDGSHAREELEENARAWLGLVLLVASEFYGEYLNDKAKQLIEQLKLEASPASKEVS